ncbi:MAG: hypothetical protein JWP75_3951, partial [Frondihabitans sp.]|nr:hypothetical protein [Frondihabitans sp.]
MFWPRTTPVLYRFDMWNIPRVSLLAVATALLLSGCAPGDSGATRDPTPSSTPIFATEEEALAAATAAYAAYVRVSDQILMDGGADPDRIKQVAGPVVAKEETRGYKKFVELHFRTIGATTFDSAKLQSFSPTSTNGKSVVTSYLCVDASKVDVLNEQNDSVVSPERPDRVGFEVHFDTKSSDSRTLIVSSKEVWTQ